MIGTLQNYFAFDLHISILLFLALLGITFIFFKNRKNKTLISILVQCAIWLYLLLLIKIVICPIIYLRPENRDAFYTAVGGQSLFQMCTQFIPGKTITTNFSSARGILQNVGNLVLLLPIPILLLFKKKTILPPVRQITIIFLTSIAIEALQFIINIIGQYPSHAVDIDDIILNTLGGCIGIILSYFLYHFQRRKE